jgi:chain length determinant protein tyrosine kinase EpsG
MEHQVHPVATLPLKADDKSSMGSILLEMGKLAPKDIDRVLDVQRRHGLRFGEAAKLLNLISETDVQQVLARQFDYEYLQPGEGKYAPELVAAYHPFSPQVETLRAVRTQLMQRWFARGRRTLAIAGINRGEGVSLFAANLAVVFSQLGERTMLIDANLRRPRQHEIFNLKGRQGLSDILADRAGMETFSKVDSFLHLSVLPAGTRPPNPQELISRDSFDEVSKSLSSRFDVILIDVPAFSAGADALAIAARVGGVLLVCRKDVTSLTQLDAAGVQIERAGAEVVASVLVDF